MEYLVLTSECQAGSTRYFPAFSKRAIRERLVVRRHEVSKSLADEIRKLRRVLTAAEVEGYLGIDVKTLYRMAKQGRIPSFKLGGKVCFDCYQLADWYTKRCEG